MATETEQVRPRTLVSSSGPRVDDPVDATFSTTGYLSEKFSGYSPRDGQIKLARAVHAAIVTGDHLICEGPTGCHVRGQQLLMFDGTLCNVESIVVGDKLMGPNGAPRTVLRLARGREEIVQVEPVKGNPWRVNRSHVLTLVSSGSGTIRDISIPEFLEESKNKKRNSKLFRAEVKRFGSKRQKPHLLKIDPYHLGVLLGDGGMASGSVGITKPTQLIKDVAYEIAKWFGLSIRTDIDKKSGCPTHYIVNRANGLRNPLISALRELHLYGTGARWKFIPARYRTASRKNRLKLLAGLMDTDGSKTDNCFDFVSASKILVDDIAFVARSVGLAAYPEPCTKSAGPGHSDTYYRVCISGHTDMIPCRDPAKKCGPRKQIKNVLRTGFKIVECGYEDDYFGFTLDGDGRYLLDDFTVTHNTGKSFAYLVPAIHEAVFSGKKIVIATANIALQEQLCEKDLPQMAEILPWRFSFALFKGKSNYLCLDREAKLLGKQERQQTQMFDNGQKQSFDGEIKKLLAWAAETNTGDKSELTFVPAGGNWARLSVGADDCKGKRCRHAKNCFSLIAREEAKLANIVVCNFHVLFANMKFGGAVLPPFDVAILDEAHEAVGVARDFLGFRMAPGAFKRLARFLEKQNMPGLAAEMNKRGSAFFDELREYAKSDAYNVRIRRPGVVKYEPLVSALEEVEEELRGKQAEAPSDDAKADIEIERNRAKAMKDVIVSGMELEDDNTVVFIEQDFRDADKVALKGKPINVAGLLRSQLFLTTPSVILTSATLATDGTFDYIEDEIGVREPSRLIVESPFDHNNALFIVPDDFVDPRDNGFQDALADGITDTICRARGRTLCLFTSFRNLNYVYDKVAGRIDEVMLYKQGDKPRTQLVEDFRNDVDGVLFGVSSFWAGVDVPGESLSCVIIDKLPFPSPADPVLDALNEKLRGKSFLQSSFFVHSVPSAIVMFKQGFGRLIRSVDDRGVIVCFDNRLTTKGYGKRFTRSLPSVRRSRDLYDVARFLGTEGNPLRRIDETNEHSSSIPF